jgi:hypothetical protein
MGGTGVNGVDKATMASGEDGRDAQAFRREFGLPPASDPALFLFDNVASHGAKYT